ncbi:MAG: hypothetical protein OEW75_11860 [Cyclobacteriaceae bacterium]|nr:hypothetical protein [Cyclobacteriaceae bacterium]
MHKKLLLVVFLPLLFISCLEEPECVQLNNNYIKVSFKSATDGTVLPVLVDSVFSEEYIGNFYKGTDETDVYLPLSPVFQQMSFILQTPYKRDTVQVSYNYLPKLYGTQCEVSAMYQNVEITKISFDSLKINVDQIPPNVQVYY